VTKKELKLLKEVKSANTPVGELFKVVPLIHLRACRENRTGKQSYGWFVPLYSK